MTTEILPVLANARDLAGAAPGLRAGAVFRSDAPFAGDDAPEGLAPWPPAAVVDLRDAREFDGAHPFADSATIHAIPVLGDAVFDPSMMKRSLVDLYRDMVVGAPARAIVRAVVAIAGEPGPVLVHCTAGKDRTGVSVALTLALVGVDREAIVADYVATHANMRGVMARSRSSWNGEMPPLPEGVDLEEIMREMMSAPAAAIEAVLDAWAAAGGAEAWFLAHGGTTADVAALRERLLG
ncbi:tyrosine-protein phosphatase [Demequina rhizosphaerae]|uniref:tyrosine-protein phosphatase n=1 Tax=Demequina rhizosphaerae TaxID=1638985 RepID=UPI0007822D7F|nr:tyrosine-protein phosphatase [Demequina rhizosphaerae]